MSKLNVKWTSGLTIAGSTSEKNINFDSKHGEHTELDGSSPTEVFLLSIIGCSTMTAVSLLNKKRIEFGGAEAEIEAKSLSSNDSAYQFTRFQIKYSFSKIAEDDYKKISESVAMAHDKYCPMIFMVKKIAPVQYEIYIDNVLTFKSENWENIE